MANYNLKFGSYQFPSTFYPASVPSDSRIDTAEIPRRDGVVASDARLKEKVVTVRGFIRADTPDALRLAMDYMLGSINYGRQKLYLWDDRYIWAQKQSFTTDYDPTSFKRYCAVSIDFLSDTALWEADTESSDTWSSPANGATHDIAVGGTAYTEPVFEITAAATGTLDIELSIGDSVFTLSGEVNAGDVLVVDCGDQTVTLDLDDSDYMSMFDMVFLRLTGNATNTLKYTQYEGSAGVSQIVTKWRDRWY
jgi:phage-related protein